MTGDVSSTTDLATTTKAVSDEVKTLPSFRKISPGKRLAFSVDLALITHSVRIGYLVDVVAPRNPVDAFSQLLLRLRQASRMFENVIHLYDPESDQSFFINIPMLLGETTRSATLPLSWGQHARALTTGLSFVSLHPDQRCELLPGPPEKIITVLQSLMIDISTVRSQRPASITLPLDIGPKTMIPLAALILGYLVAYAPEMHGGAAFLANTPLDVYECRLSFEDGTEHTLLKFSCPSELTGGHPDPMRPPSIIQQLDHTFRPRLHQAAPGAKLLVFHNLKTLDRVAL